MNGMEWHRRELDPSRIRSEFLRSDAGVHAMLTRFEKQKLGDKTIPSRIELLNRQSLGNGDS